MRGPQTGYWRLLCSFLTETSFEPKDFTYFDLKSSWRCKEPFNSVPGFSSFPSLLFCVSPKLADIVQRFSCSCSWPHIGSAWAEGWGSEVWRRGICFNFPFGYMFVGLLFVSFTCFEANGFLCPRSSALFLSDSLLFCIARLENVCVFMFVFLLHMCCIIRLQ